MPMSNRAHPRLLFDGDDLPQLRERLTKGTGAEYYQALLRSCRACMTPGDPLYVDFRERRSDLWRERKGIFHVLPSMEALAVGYAFTGDAAIGDCARDLVMTIIEHGLADVKTQAWGNPYDGWRHDVGHDKGKFACAIAWAYDMCHDRFSQDQRRRFAEYARETIALADKVLRRDVDQIANNRGIRGQLGRSWLHLALEGEFDLGQDAEAVYRSAQDLIDIHLAHTADPDGAPYEGPNYVSYSSLIAIAEAMRRRGMPNLLGHHRFERLINYYLYELIPGGGSTNNLNDCDLPAGNVQQFLHLAGTTTGELIPWLARQLDLHPSRRDGINPEGMASAWNVVACAKWWDDALPVRTPQQLGYPISHWFPQRGVADLRTGWGGDDWLVSHFCGRQERRCHRQGDYNHVSFYALGETFLADAGYGALKGGRDMREVVDRWFQDTDVHNCVMIDGKGFRTVWNETGWAEGQMIDFQHTDAFDTSLGDASGAIGPDHRVRQALRRVVMVRQGPAPYVAVIDVNEKDGAPFEARHIWQTLPGNSIELTKTGFLIKGQHHHCTAHVFCEARPEFTLKDNVLAQVLVTAREPVVETVTVFCPRRQGEPGPGFACRRTGPGAFEITCKHHGATSVLHAAAAVRGPLYQPLPVELRVR